MATCRRRSCSGEVVAILSWARDLGEGISGPACQGHPPRWGVVSRWVRVTRGRMGRGGSVVA
eukprot:67674-Pyramimonas_sp.AAC.1